MSLPLISLPLPTTTPQTKAVMAALLGLPFQVSKGLPVRGIQRGQKGTIRQVVHQEGGGFAVRFEINGKDHTLWAMSSARFSGEVISLNTGNPLNNVKLTRLPR